MQGRNNGDPVEPSPSRGWVQGSAAMGTACRYSLSLTQGIPQQKASLTLHCGVGSYPNVLAGPFPLPLPLQHHGTKLARKWHCIV